MSVFSQIPVAGSSAGRPRPGGHRAPRASLACVLLAAALLGLAGCGSAPKNEPINATAERLYREAADDMASGAFERSIKGFERVEGLAAGTVLAQQAQLNIAYLHWRNDDRAQALTSVERFIKLNPSSPALDYALYLRGLINFNDSLGLFGRLARQDSAERDQRGARDAYAAFKQLVDRFPESGYSPDARLRMDFIVNSLARQEVAVARYYYNRGAYMAAANRAQQVITEYPQTPATEDALALMVRSYDRLRLGDLRDAAQRVLDLNFPGSRALTAIPG
jgi:outer membrane protein assembly factor BamD